MICGSIVDVTEDRMQSLASITPHRGSDELNLIDFPIGVLRHQQPKAADDRTPDELVCTIESYDAELDRVIPRTLTRRTSSKYGFPTPLDEEVLIGLLTLTRQKNNFTSAHVKFRNRELYDLMGWHNNGRAKHRLSKALDRLKGLNLKYENSWTSGDNKFEKEFSTGLLDSYELVTRNDSASDANTESSVRWAAEVFADMQRGHVKELDTDCFFSLRLSVAKRLYRYLDRYLKPEQPLEMELTKLAAHMGIADTSHIGKIKERLADGIRELEDLGNFIKPAERDQRYRKKRAGLWLIRFERANADVVPRKITNESGSTRNVGVIPNGESTQLVSAFYSLWTGDRDHKASRHELFQAGEIIRRYGREKATTLLPIVVKMMKKDFPNAYAFGATKNFWPMADEQSNRKAKRLAQAAQQSEEQSREEERVKAQKAKLNAQREEWNQLPDSRQSEIRQRIMDSSSTSEALKGLIRRGKFADPMVLLACLAELNRQET